MFRVLPLIVTGVAMVVAAGTTVYAADVDKNENHQGVVVKAGDGKLTMTDKDGKNEHTHDIGLDAKITRDDKEAKLGDLKKGDTVKVTTALKGDKKVVTHVAAKKPV